MAFMDDAMAPAFPAGSNAPYERQKGELVSGGYYIFHGRAQLSACADRRALLGHHADRPVCGELFKDATGKPHRAFLDLKQWHAYYRIVRH